MYMYVEMYICAYIYVYVYIHIYIRLYICEELVNFHKIVQTIPKVHCIESPKVLPFVDSLCHNMLDCKICRLKFKYI